MGRRNSNHKTAVPTPEVEVKAVEKKIVTVSLTEDEVNLLINVIRVTPIQGNIQTLHQMMTRIENIQLKLIKSLET